MSELGAVIRSVVFTPTRLRRGYGMAEVDVFLDEAARAADAGQDLSDMVREARFTTTSLGEGYDTAEVDDFLDLVVKRSAPGAADLRPPVDQPPVDQTVREPLPSAIQEQRGLLGRLFGRG